MNSISDSISDFLQEGTPRNNKYEKWRESVMNSASKRFNGDSCTVVLFDDPVKPRIKKDTLQLLKELYDVL